MGKTTNRFLRGQIVKFQLKLNFSHICRETKFVRQDLRNKYLNFEEQFSLHGSTFPFLIFKFYLFNSFLKPFKKSRQNKNFLWEKYCPTILGNWLIIDLNKLLLIARVSSSQSSPFFNSAAFRWQTKDKNDFKGLKHLDLEVISDHDLVIWGWKWNKLK